jgi:type IV pilus assembly protein PilQ
MNGIGARKFLSSVVATSLMWQPLHAAIAPVTPVENTAAADDMGASNSTIGFGDSPSGNRNASLIMGGISLPKNPISMDFQEADVRDVIHLLAVKSGLNIIYGADVSGPITVHLDRVPYDQAFQTVLTLKSLVALPMGTKVIRVVSSQGLTQEQSQAATFTRVFRLNYANAEDVKRPIDAIRGAAGRKGVSSVDSKTNSLIITDTQEGLKEVEDLIPVLDKKPQQVDIESKIVEVSLDNQTDTGISWQYAATVRSPSPGRTTPSTAVGATEAETSASAAGLGGTVGGTVISPLAPVQGGTGVTLNDITQTGFSFVNRQGTYLLSAQIAALASQGRVKILSTPHVVTTNNEEAKISVADRIPYQVTTVSNGVSQQNVQFIEAGVKLTVKPTVNADRRITLKVKPEVSNDVGGSTANLPPRVNTRNAETTVVLRDGETIAIGGLITENNQKSVVGVPVLMSIPILGYLFKQTSDRKRRVELIVFLTPKIAAE